MTHRLAAVLVICLLAAGCASAGQASPSSNATPTNAPSANDPTASDSVVAPCDAAFAQAAAVDAMHDTIEDLYPAVEACTTLDAWVAASDANPGAVSEGVDPLIVLGNICGNNTDLAATDLCGQAKTACQSAPVLQETMICLLETQ